MGQIDHPWEGDSYAYDLTARIVSMADLLSVTSSQVINTWCDVLSTHSFNNLLIGCACTSCQVHFSLTKPLLIGV